MNAKKAKLLRKVARLSGRTDTYIKKTFKAMPPEQQVAYLAFMKENLRRIEEMRKNMPIVTDAPREAVL